MNKKIIGNDKIKNQLLNIVHSKKISHAYLFSGVDGVGKYLFARKFSKAILDDEEAINFTMSNEDDEALNSHQDFYVIEPSLHDGSVKISINKDDIRELEEEVALKPVVANRKIFIIRDADVMTEETQNLLLKTLEEPPTYVTIILIATSTEKIINTIKSRVTNFSFNPLTKDELIDAFDGENIDENLLDFSSGSCSKLIKLSSSNYISLVQMLEETIEKNDLLYMNKTITEVKSLKTIKDDIDDILNLLIIKLNTKITTNTMLIVKQIQAIEEVRVNIKRNVNFEDSLDYLMIRLWEIRNA